MILVRGVHFAMSLLAGGTISFATVVAEPAARGLSEHQPELGALRQRLNRLLWCALAGAVASGAIWITLLAAGILGTTVSDAVLHGGAATVLTETRFGQVFILRAGLALVLALLLRWPRTRWLQLAAAGGFVAALALTGHAGATPGAAGNLHLTSDVLHLLAAGAWLGGLPALAILLAGIGNTSGHVFINRAVARFSWLGIVSVGTLVATGIVNSYFLLSSIDDLVATDYGRLLFLKIGLFIAMLAVAAVNKFHLTPKLAAPRAVRALQRNTLAETALGIGVLLLVAALGNMAPAAHRHTPPPDIPPDAAFVHIHSSEAMADVTVNPGRAGPTRITVRVLREDFSEFPAQAVRLVLDPPAPTTKAVERAAIDMPDGTWQVDALDLGMPGIWTIRVVITPAAGPPIVLDAPIVIDRRM